MTVPENHVTAEGRTLKAALEDAATQLGVPASLVEHKLDMAHFRSNTGKGIGVDTVKIFAWAKNPGEYAPLLAAEEWVKGLLAAMDRKATVKVDRRGNAVVVAVDAGEESRHLVGRGGTTVRAIQHLLERSVGPRFPQVEFRLDIVGGEPRRDDDRPRRDDDRGYDRPRDDRRDDRPRDDRFRDDRPRDDRPRDDRPRDDRPRDDRPRDDRPRDDRPRDDRRDDRGPPRRDDRGPPRRDDRRDDRRDGPRRERRTESDDDALKRLARKVAERVKETGETELIRRDLNAYDRRIVHLEIKSVPGLGSRSIGEGRERRIEVFLSDGETESAE